MSKIIGISRFVMRQTLESEFTHFTGTWEELAELAGKHYSLSNEGNEKVIEKGYRDGVFILHIKGNDVKKFYTYTDYPFIIGMKLNASYRHIAGRENEPPKIVITPEEPKAVCRFVDLILYSKEVLQEDNDTSTACDFEIVSINGRLKDEPVPIDPMTIVRNWKHLPGGTEMKGTTAEEVLEMLCQSILYKNGLGMGEGKKSD